MQIAIVIQMAFTGAFVFILSDDDEYRTQSFGKTFFMVAHNIIQGSEVQSPADDDVRGPWLNNDYPRPTLPRVNTT